MTLETRLITTTIINPVECIRIISKAIISIEKKGLVSGVIPHLWSWWSLLKPESELENMNLVFFMSVFVLSSLTLKNRLMFIVFPFDLASLTLRKESNLGFTNINVANIGVELLVPKFCSDMSIILSIKSEGNQRILF